MEPATNVQFIEGGLGPQDKLCVSHSASMERDQEKLMNGHSPYSQGKGCSQVWNGL